MLDQTQPGGGVYDLTPPPPNRVTWTRCPSSEQSHIHPWKQCFSHTICRNWNNCNLFWRSFSWVFSQLFEQDRYGGDMGYGGGADRYGGPPSRGGGGFPSAEGTTASGASAPNAPGMLQQGSVLMVYGINMEKINCARLFNLFCLYGNVVRVRFYTRLNFHGTFGVPPFLITDFVG